MKANAPAERRCITVLLKKTLPSLCWYWACVRHWLLQHLQSTVSEWVLPLR